MVYHQEKLSGTAEAGAWTANTKAFLGGLMESLHVYPASVTTQFTLTITGPDDEQLVKTTHVGPYTDYIARPVRGIYSVAITGSSANEVFKSKMMVRNR